MVTPHGRERRRDDRQRGERDEIRVEVRVDVGEGRRGEEDPFGHAGLDEDLAGDPDRQHEPADG
jgi:hypothetical protein